MTTHPFAKHVRLLSALLLVIGLIGSAWIFAAPADSSGVGVTGYDLVGGQAFAVKTGDSKRDLYEIERMNGKFGLIAGQISQWWQSQWQGWHKARSIAILSVALASLGWLVARELDLHALHEADQDAANGSKAVKPT
jgi:hypothetical protein